MWQGIEECCSKSNKLEKCGNMCVFGVHFSRPLILCRTFVMNQEMMIMTYISTVLESPPTILEQCVILLELHINKKQEPMWQPSFASNLRHDVIYCNYWCKETGLMKLAALWLTMAVNSILPSQEVLISVQVAPQTNQQLGHNLQPVPFTSSLTLNQNLVNSSKSCSLWRRLQTKHLGTKPRITCSNCQSSWVFSRLWYVDQ